MSRMAIFVLSVASVLGCSTNKGPQSVQRPYVMRVQTVEGAVVPSEWQAKEIAMHAASPGELHNATTLFQVEACFRLDFDIPGFAKQGDRIWPVKESDMAFPSRRTIWINAENSAVKVISTEQTICSKYVDYERRRDDATGEFILMKK